MINYLNEYDVFFLSYDEPNADENYSDLVKKIPWAKRVHGIKGSDKAHKECARQSTTDRLIIIDGDNQVDPTFIEQKINFDLFENSQNSVFSWSAKNIINNLEYGNGGIKFWPKHVIMNMQTHENAQSANALVDFCWVINYVQVDIVASTTINNATPFQAFRAGFREGIKMALLDGQKTNNPSLIYPNNFTRLLVWLTIGSDSKNGEWAIFGARQALFKLLLGDWDWTLIRDYDWLNEHCNKTIARTKNVKEEILDLGLSLKNVLPVDLPYYDAQQSKFFKRFFVNPTRSNIKSICDV